MSIVTRKFVGTTGWFSDGAKPETVKVSRAILRDDGSFVLSLDYSSPLEVTMRPTLPDIYEREFRFPRSSSHGPATVKALFSSGNALFLGTRLEDTINSLCSHSVNPRGSADPSLRHRRDRQRELPLQEPKLTNFNP